MPLLRYAVRRPLSPLHKVILCRGRYSTSNAIPLVQILDFPAPNSGRIRVLSLNRPEARNAISRQLLYELRSAIDSISSEYASNGSETGRHEHEPNAQEGPTRALIVASDVDSCFCAGADLKERAGFTQEETDAFLATLRSTFTALSSLPIPTISAVSSVALGGGLELALSTQLRVFASTAIVGLPETRLGIIPGAGGTYRLTGLLGLSRARDMILTGRRVSGGEAYVMGIANRLVDIITTKEGEDKETILKRAKEETLKGAVELAAEICLGAPTAIRAAIEATEAATEVVENKCYEKVVGTDDRNEALVAFREKRRPVFTGR